MATENESRTIEVCPVAELEPGSVRIVETGEVPIAVFNCEGEILAIEDRCSHDDGPLAEGNLDQAGCTIECPRHGSIFDLRSGQPKTLPAFQPVRTFPVDMSDDTIKVEV